MSKFIIEGQQPLSGTIRVLGNKNAALPIIAACLLTDEECILENVPEIKDVHAMFAIARDIGKTITKLDENIYSIKGEIHNSFPKIELVQKLRASILFFGVLLARTGTATLAPPGGCVIGRRHLEPHFNALNDLGMDIAVGEHAYSGTQKKTDTQQRYTFLNETSVTATENALIVAAGFKGKTVIENAACEPHVSDLVDFLNKMGAEISGKGSNRLIVEGKNGLKGVKHRISSDYIESGTFAILAAATQSQLTITHIEKPHLQMTGYLLEKMGAKLKFHTNDSAVDIIPGPLKSPQPKIQVGLWPNFPTDLMSPMIVLLTQASGMTLCHDWMFESRMFFVDKLIAMGADITLCDPHRAIINGPKQLRAQNLSSPDIRAGVALVIAALAARGKSVIANAELVDRGYEKIVARLQSIGAKIERVE